MIFLSGVVEQLDLALEHISKGDLHNARFGLMLTDNALELVLHQIVKTKRREATGWGHHEKPYRYQSQLRKAFLGSFSDKIAFACLEGGLSQEVARTFNIMHEYRNDVYHAGLEHHAILLSLTRFYFDTACTYIATYNPIGLSWGSAVNMPERAKKYFKGNSLFSGSYPGNKEQFVEACKSMIVSNAFDPKETTQILADYLDQVIDHMDKCLQVVANGVYIGQQVTRDQAVLRTQAWDLAFDDKGRAFGKANGFTGSLFQFVEFLGEKYPHKYKRDPIPNWEKQAKKLRAKGNAHLALEHYQSFVKETGSFRGALEQSAGAAEAEIESASERMRGR